MFDLLVKNARMVAPDGELVRRDLAVQGGVVVAVGDDLPASARRTLNADGCLLLPGVIDIHTHLRSTAGEPDLFAGETASAVAGGVTMVGDFAYPAGTRFELDFSTKRDRLAREARCDFCLHTVVRAPEHLEQAQSWTVKVFFSASGLGAQAGNALAFLQAAVAKGHQVLAHVERMEDYQAILQHGITAGGTGRVHILHVPHQRFVSLVQAAGNSRITLESCPHYLLWERTWGQSGCDVNPPVEPNDLWPELKAGRVHTLGTDHCSYTQEEKKELGLPGFPGVEALLPLMVTYGVRAGRISWADLCHLLCAGPAGVLGLYPRKGSLQLGSDADMVIFDPGQEYYLAAPVNGRGNFSPYAGMRLEGKVVSTYVRGREVYSDGTLDPSTVGWGIWQDRGFR